MNIVPRSFTVVKYSSSGKIQDGGSRHIWNTQTGVAYLDHLLTDMQNFSSFCCKFKIYWIWFFSYIQYLWLQWTSISVRTQILPLWRCSRNHAICIIQDCANFYKFCTLIQNDNYADDGQNVGYGTDATFHRTFFFLLLLFLTPLLILREWKTLRCSLIKQGFHRHQTPSRYGTITPLAFHAAPYGPLRRNLTSPVKPEVHNVSQRRQNHGHRASAQNKSWKLVQRFQRYARGQTHTETDRRTHTDTHTDRQTDRNTPLRNQGGVKSTKTKLEWTLLLFLYETVM